MKNCLTCLSVLAIALGLCGCAVEPTQRTELRDWPRIDSAIGRNDAIEAEVARLLARMTLAQKIGQMTQPEIGHVTPAQVTQFAIGSVLNGGGSWPQGNKTATAGDWVALADQYYDASMASGLETPVPLIWGTDAMHGHSNVYSATLFPHNIGLGAARDPALIEQIGAAVARQVRATGINWVFAPTVAVARDVRWGRTYESFSQDGALVNGYAKAYVTGLQGRFADDAKVVATAKHFMGDGATELGKDQGLAKISEAEMMNVHAQGYYGALAAGVQTVMVSLSSWIDVATNRDYGKNHGNRYLLTEVLKDKMGFDGFVVTDWDGISQLPDCSPSRCAQAINAGIDMVMVPEEWQAFIRNTMEQVRQGEIPMARIDDAVSRILRVKLRAGLFGRKPSQGAYAGQAEALQARALARQAVRESLVLLKNERQLLPLARDQRILVVGKSANNLPNQLGGWSLTWQGTETTNADFPLADSVLDGIREQLGRERVEFSEAAQGMDLSRFDAVIAVIGEAPYAEFSGDITLADSLKHSRRYPDDLAVLQAVSGKGVPVVTVLLSGRPVYANDLLNLSDAFVAAWLPGTEGKGVSDLLFRQVDGRVAHDFVGKLSFSWPRTACQAAFRRSDAPDAPLFAFGYGLNSASTQNLGRLELDPLADGCGKEAAIPIFNQSDRAPYALYVSSAANQWARARVGADLHATLNLPATNPSIRVETAQINTQHDAKRVTWFGPARFFAAAAQKQSARSHAMSQGVLQFDMELWQSPSGPVKLAIECGAPCRGELDFTAILKKTALHQKRTVKIPLLCFEDAGSDFLNMDIPFSVYAEQPFSAAFTQIQLVSGAAQDADALSCADLSGAAGP